MCLNIGVIPFTLGIIHHITAYTLSKDDLKEKNYGEEYKMKEKEYYKDRIIYLLEKAQSADTLKRVYKLLEFLYLRE